MKSQQFIFVRTKQGKIFQVSEIKSSKGVMLAKKKCNGKWYCIVEGDEIFNASSFEKENHEEWENIGF